MRCPTRPAAARSLLHALYYMLFTTCSLLHALHYISLVQPVCLHALAALSGCIRSCATCIGSCATSHTARHLTPHTVATSHRSDLTPKHPLPALQVPALAMHATPMRADGDGGIWAMEKEVATGLEAQLVSSSVLHWPTPQTVACISRRCRAPTLPATWEGPHFTCDIGKQAALPATFPDQRACSSTAAAAPAKKGREKKEMSAHADPAAQPRLQKKGRKNRKKKKEMRAHGVAPAQPIRAYKLCLPPPAPPAKRLFRDTGKTCG